MDDVNAVVVEPVTVRDARFDAWHAVIAEAYAHGRRPAFWESLPATRAYFARAETHTRYLGLVATRGGEVVGGAELGLPLDEDTQTVTVELGVRPDERGHGVGAALADAVRAVAAQQGRTLVQAELFVPDGTGWAHWPGARFAGRHGMRPVSTEHRYVLTLPVDLPAPAGGDDALVSFVGPVPPPLEAEWARMRTQMNQDVPTGGLTLTAREIDVARIRESDRAMAEQGWTKVRCAAFAADGTGLGYTELLVSAHHPDVVVQDDTLVDRAARGRGLGLRLKTANLRQLQEHDGGRLLGSRRTVQTFVEQDNLAMQRTNARLGFVRVETLHECETTLD